MNQMSHQCSLNELSVSESVDVEKSSEHASSDQTASIIQQLQAKNQALTQELALTKRALGQSYDQLQCIYYWAETTEQINRASTVEEILAVASVGLQKVFNAPYAAAVCMQGEDLIPLQSSPEHCKHKMLANYNPWQNSQDYQPIVIASVADLTENQIGAHVAAQKKRLLMAQIQSLIWLPIVGKGLEPVEDLKPDAASSAWMLADADVDSASKTELPVQLLGYLSLYYDRPETFDDALLYLAQNMAHTIVFAIERKQAEVALQQTLKKLRKTQLQLIQNEKMSSLGQLVAGVAHEINNPVSFIYGNLDHIEEYAEGLLKLVELYSEHAYHPVPQIKSLIEEIDLAFIVADFPKTLDSMRLGTERIRDIIKSLRTFSRLDEADLKSVDLHEGIDSTLMILKHRLKADDKCPEIKVIKEYGDLAPVNCYPGPLNQVFMNVLVNAIDALETHALDSQLLEVRSRPPAENHEFSTETSDLEETSDLDLRILIRTAVIDNHCVEISIADNGPGVPESVQSRIFDPFFTTKPIGTGTGMGMSISYKIITDTHRGQLTCVSALGEGAKFIIRIPLDLAQTNGCASK